MLAAGIESGCEDFAGVPCRTLELQQDQNVWVSRTTELHHLCLQTRIAIRLHVQSTDQRMSFMYDFSFTQDTEAVWSSKTYSLYESSTAASICPCESAAIEVGV